MVRKLGLLSLFMMLLIAACSQIGVPGNVVTVPTTGNTSNDAAAAQQYVPDLPGYLTANATSITSALDTISGGAALISGNPITAAMIAQLDGMVSCYNQVGAIAAKIYTQANIASLAQGQTPEIGALAVVNQDRVANNFLPCALGSGRGFSAQAVQANQPCSSSGSFQANGNTYLYLYGATQQDLCTLIQQHLPASPG